jgi:prepilin peptidase CpaA
MDTVTSIAQALTSVALTPRTGLLLMFLVAAAVSDVLTYRIPNWLTVSGMLAGVVASTLDAPVAVMPTVLASLGGLFVGLVCLMPLHALRLMGAGDVKLMAVVGAFIGFPAVLMAILFTLVAGGVMAVVWTLALRLGRRVASNVGGMFRSVAIAAWTRTSPVAPAFQSAGRLPYAVCILAGTTVFLVVRQMAR